MRDLNVALYQHEQSTKYDIFNRVKSSSISVLFKADILHTVGLQGSFCVELV